MSSPIFTIILTTYNRAMLLPRAIQSVLAQTFTDFELWVVDDASTEPIHDIIASFPDPRLHYIRLEVNSGVSIARNSAITRAAGEYVAFVDDDDTIEPGFLAEVYAVFSKAPPTVGFLWTWKYLAFQTDDGVNRDKVQTYHIDHSRPFAGADYLRHSRGGSGGLVVRLSAIHIVGLFNPEFRTHEDSDFLMRIAERFDFVIVPKFLYTIFEHRGERLTRKTLERTRTFERLTEIHYPTFQRFPKLLNGRYRLLGGDYYRLGDRRAGRKYLYKAIQGQPLNVMHWVAFFLFECSDYLPQFIKRKYLKF